MAYKFEMTPDRMKFIYIFNDTMAKINQNEVTEIVNNSTGFTDEDNIDFERKNFDTKIYLDNKDTFDKAIEMGGEVAVLNMASLKNAGGGVRIGCKAQEECLCRRSNLYPVLKSFIYPLPKISTIYTPGISVIKDNKYNLYGTPYKVNVLSAAMCKLHEGDVFTKEHCLIAKQKIEHLLKTALHFNQRKLVLGAWGCGAYHCPPDTIAKIFKIVLDDPMFKNQFEEICFAILDWQGKNYQAFSKVFK